MGQPMIAPSMAQAEDGPVIVTAVLEDKALRHTRRHRHARGQLLGASHGLLSVQAMDHLWVVPATHAVWIPPQVPHGLQSHGPFSGWSVYVSGKACATLPQAPRVFEVSGLLREAVARAASWAAGDLSDAQQRLAGVMLDEIAITPAALLGLPMPKDARLLKIAHALAAQPEAHRGLQAWADWAGIAPRTLSRRFVAETGFTFTAWRQRARLLNALEQLAAGQAVTTVALASGYDNVSGFIATFRRVFGVTPGQYRRSR